LKIFFTGNDKAVDQLRSDCELRRRELVGVLAEAGPNGIFVDVLEVRPIVAGVFDATEGKARLPDVQF